MADPGPNVTCVVFNEIVFSFFYKGIFFGPESTWFANSRCTPKAEWMAETQEDRTADVKTLYEEPFTMAFGVLIPLLQPLTRCPLPPVHKYWLLLLLLAAYLMLLLVHPFIPNMGYPSL